MKLRYLEQKVAYEIKDAEDAVDCSGGVLFKYKIYFPRIGDWGV